MAVPKRKTSRSNTRHRRSQWKAKLPQINKVVRNGRVEFVIPHRADDEGQYNGRQVVDLCHRARVTVEKEARRSVRLVESVAHHGVGDRVGNVLAGVHEALGLAAQRGAALDVGAEDVARRDVRNAQALGHSERLGSLARTRRAHEDDAHQRRNPS